MFGTSELSSLTWDSAAWIYSVIIGLVIVRYFMFAANLLQQPKAIKFYYPYLAFASSHILHMYANWYTGAQAYTMIEGNALLFLLRSSRDAVGCIGGLIIVPQDKLLEGFFDMKSWFMKIRKAHFLVWGLYALLYIMQVTLIFSSFAELTSPKEMIVGLSLLMTMTLLLFGAAFSENDYYLSIIGTFFVVFNLIQLTTL